MCTEKLSATLWPDPVQPLWARFDRLPGYNALTGWADFGIGPCCLLDGPMFHTSVDGLRAAQGAQWAQIDWFFRVVRWDGEWATGPFPGWHSRFSV